MPHYRLKSVLTILLFYSVIYGKPAVSIDSLSGTAEVQRAGTIQWTYITKDTKFHDNDMIRVPDSGSLVLSWPDGSKTYLHQKTQILITLFKQKKDQTVLPRATILSGTAFFIVNKLASQNRSEKMRVYTPTSVISIRGTSFLVTVNSMRNSTSVKMFEGLVVVKNVQKNISILLGTPYQTVIEKNANPTPPTAVLTSDIDSLKAWIPENVIGNEITKQIDISKQDRKELFGNFEEKCLIAQFINTSGYNGPWEIEHEITRTFATLLRKNLAMTVILIADSIVDDPIETAKHLNARYCITGKIDLFDLTKHAEISTQADEYREAVIARSQISIKFTDLSQNKELLNQSFTTEISGKNNRENTWNTFHKYSFVIGDPILSKTIIGQSIQKSIESSIKSTIKSTHQ